MRYFSLSVYYKLTLCPWSVREPKYCQTKGQISTNMLTQDFSHLIALLVTNPKFIAKINIVLSMKKRDLSVVKERDLKFNEIIIFSFSVANCRNRTMLYDDLLI